MPHDIKFVPLYERTAEKISQYILQNNLQNGDFLGTLLDIRKRYHVSGNTARQAVTRLEVKGILRCKSAVGIYVHNRGILNILNTFNRVILIIHNHHKKHLRQFFELRLSSMLQNFMLHGYACLPIYREELDSDRIQIIAPQICGIVSGSRRYPKIRDLFQDRIPLLCINPPGDAETAENNCLVSYDFPAQHRMALQYFDSCPHRKIIQLYTDQLYQFPLPAHISKIGIAKKELLANAVTAGHRLGEQLFRQAPESAFWITDDLVSIGFCQAFLKHGIDLIAEKRILAFGSPSGQVTLEMGLPVIGFCPMEIGRLAAEVFSAFLDSGPGYNHSHNPVMIPPSANPAASVILKSQNAPAVR